MQSIVQLFDTPEQRLFKLLPAEARRELPKIRSEVAQRAASYKHGRLAALQQAVIVGWLKAAVKGGETTLGETPNYVWENVLDYHLSVVHRMDDATACLYEDLLAEVCAARRPGES